MVCCNELFILNYLKKVAIASTEIFFKKIEKENSNCVEEDVITSIDINNEVD